MKIHNFNFLIRQMATVDKKIKDDKLFGLGSDDN
jgi:hypothetical protein